MANITTDQVWSELEGNIFAVLGMVSAKHEARTAGIVYIVRDRVLYIGSSADAWKVRHIRANPNVSLTATIPKRVVLMPWLKIPAATITFAGDARLLDTSEINPDVLESLFEGMTNTEELRNSNVVIAVKPKGNFLTYGVGVSVMDMRDPTKAGGRVSVA